MWGWCFVAIRFSPLADGIGLVCSSSLTMGGGGLWLVCPWFQMELAALCLVDFRRFGKILQLGGCFRARIAWVLCSGLEAVVLMVVQIFFGCSAGGLFGMIYVYVSSLRRRAMFSPCWHDILFFYRFLDDRISRIFEHYYIGGQDMFL